MFYLFVVCWILRRAKSQSTVGQSPSRYILGAHKTVTPKAENVINLIAPKLSEGFCANPVILSCLCTEQKEGRDDFTSKNWLGGKVLLKIRTK